MTPEVTPTVRFWHPPRHFSTIEHEVVGEMVRVLRAGDLIMRADLDRFEQTFAALIGRAHCVGVSNCTDGLRLTLEALGVGPGDEVLTVSHTFVATLAAIRHVGATPVLVDIGDDHLMDPDDLRAKITTRSRAIMPVHLNGRTCDMGRIMELAREHDLMVIEDAAQAVGARYDGTNTGAFGVASAYSFYPAKLLGAFGDAGAVVTDDDGLAHELRLLRDHGRATKTELAGWGWNCRLDNLQAAVLNVKLPLLAGWIERRRSIAARYHEGLSAIPALHLPPPPDADPKYHDVFQNYVVESPDRDDLAAYLAERGIETLISSPIPVHQQSALGLQGTSLPRTEALSDRVLSLPLYPELLDSEISHVISSVVAFSMQASLRP